MIKVYLWDPIDRKAERFEIVTEKMKVSHKSISDTRETSVRSVVRSPYRPDIFQV